MKFYENGTLVREQTDQDLDGRLELTTEYAGGARTRSKRDSNGDGKPDLVVAYTAGAKSEQREDRNFDGSDDVVTLFDAQERPTRIQQDTDGDGTLRHADALRERASSCAPRRTATATAAPTWSRSTATARSSDRRRTPTSTAAWTARARPRAAARRCRRPTRTANGAIDTWITTDASGAVLRKEEDRNGDGKKDLSAWFEGGKLARIEQDTQGRGCADLEQRFDASEKVRAEFRDTGSDCKMDVWSYFENEPHGAPGPRHPAATAAPMC